MLICGFVILCVYILWVLCWCKCSVSRDVCGYAEFGVYLSVEFCCHLHLYFYSYCGFSVVGLKGVSLAEGEVIAYVECVYSVCFGGWEYFLWIYFAGVD